MRLSAILVAALLAASLAAVAAPAANAAFGRDAYTPLVVSPLALNTQFGSAVSDGSGGMLVAWSANSDLYVQRYTATGAVAAGWPGGGLLVSNAAGSQIQAALLGDGAGGAIVAWSDSRGATQDIYATRVLGNATIAGGWTANGVLLSSNGVSATKDETNPTIATDGAGGAFVAWTLNYSGTDQDVYGAHVTAAGAVPWNTSLYSPVGYQNAPKVIADGSGGFFVGFQDNENGSFVHSKVEHFNSTGASTWGPKSIGTGTNSQNPYDIASDGAGGVYTVCSDNAFGSFWNITGNHFMPNGTSDPGWGTYKTIAYENNDTQGNPIAIPDGSGGVLVAFTDSRYGDTDLFATRIGPYGLPYAGWPAGGVALAVAPVNQFPMTMVSDGSGGAVISILDDRLNADYFLYAIRVLGNGSIAPGWNYGGNPVELGGLITFGGVPSTVADGSGGALFAWNDTRGAPSIGYEGVYAQNMDRFGQLGDARPFISRIADIPNDQGGDVSLQWTASYLDAPPSRTVAQYTVWRRVPGGTLSAAARAAATPAASPALVAGAPGARPTLRSTIEAGQVVYWEYVATEPARMLPGYSMVVPTTSDSMPAGNPRTSFMVFAEAPGGTLFWQSPPDSGYSVDNIPPYAPAPFNGTYSSGVSSLHWRADVVPDLANYRLYRGVVASFVPSPGNLVAAPTDTAYVDAAGQPYYYRLTAVDTHGNESASTLLLPSGTLGAEGALPRELSFAPPQPNPAREATTLGFALPRDANVRVAIYDIGGRRVRTLTDGAQTAGVHATPWDLRDDAGHAVGAGLYLARFEAEGRVFTRRVMAVR